MSLKAVLIAGFVVTAVPIVAQAGASQPRSLPSRPDGGVTAFEFVGDDEASTSPEASLDALAAFASSTVSAPGSQ